MDSPVIQLMCRVCLSKESAEFINIFKERLPSRGRKDPNEKKRFIDALKMLTSLKVS